MNQVYLTDQNTSEGTAKRRGQILLPPLEACVSVKLLFLRMALMGTKVFKYVQVCREYLSQTRRKEPDVQSSAACCDALRCNEPVTVLALVDLFGSSETQFCLCKTGMQTAGRCTCLRAALTC